MALEVGSRLGHYDVTALIGEGGMGQVYRATDTQLDRDVALKVLPDAFTSDPDRLARFEREAKVLASLNHPNIGAIHGLEESEGIKALVLELIEGPTLADRIAEGPIPVDEALPIAKQIAEALEAAHEQGIIHRDLKPANVKVKADGTVKVLDFGLAKAFQPEGGGVDAAASPTISLTAAATQMGMVIGTAAYMAPEQAKGLPIDKRADIWAFGAVLFEMLSGSGAFQGNDVGDVLAGVIKSPVDVSALPAATPASVRRLLRRCLEKDPSNRLGFIGDARLDIRDAETPAVADTFNVPTTPAGVRRLTVTLLIGGAVILGLAVGLGVHGLQPDPGAVEISRMLVDIEPADELGDWASLASSFIRVGRPYLTSIVLSPDGRQLAYVAQQSGEQQLYLRRLAQSRATPIPDTANARNPFFSPDGAWIGYWADGQLLKVAVDGGAPIVLCDTPPIVGATWAGNVVVFARARDGLWQIDPLGGVPQQVAMPDREAGERNYRLPHLLPGGDVVLFTVRTASMGDWTDAHLVARSLSTGMQRRIVDNAADGRYASSGHLLFVRSGRLLAAPFDVDALAITGDAVPVLDDVMQAINAGSRPTDTGAGQFSVSTSGSLAYVPGGILPDVLRTLVWVDREGRVEPLPAEPDAHWMPRLSPDGARVSTYTRGTDGGVWIYDVSRGVSQKLTNEGQGNTFPVWVSGGERVVFTSIRDGVAGVFSKSVDDGEAAEQLAPTGAPASWNEAREVLALTVGGDIWTLELGDDNPEPRPFGETPFREGHPDFSPDGRWLAYVSDETGQQDVYVTPYPGPGAATRISRDGGREPRWAPSGRELFYRSDDRMMSVDVETGPELRVGRPRTLFQTPNPSLAAGTNYDISQDGARFLMIRSNEQREPAIRHVRIVLNWTEELKARVPVD